MTNSERASAYESAAEFIANRFLEGLNQSNLFYGINTSLSLYLARLFDMSIGEADKISNEVFAFFKDSLVENSESFVESFKSKE